MRAVLSDIVTALTFDIVLLPGRLRRLDDPSERATRMVLTVISDAARCFVATCIYAVFA